MYNRDAPVKQYMARQQNCQFNNGYNQMKRNKNNKMRNIRQSSYEELQVEIFQWRKVQFISSKQFPWKNIRISYEERRNQDKIHEKHKKNKKKKKRMKRMKLMNNTSILHIQIQWFLFK
ncbi:hypothetical protein pb186bvf_020384 [Paramecium bursaria]